METANVYKRDGSTAIVHLDGRRFPAISLQGDTFWNAADFIRTLASHEDPAVREAVAGALETLDAAIDLYRSVLKELRLETPWSE